MNNLRNLDIDLLRTFATIADTRNFSRAAERLLRNQSTVSLQIKRLEDAVGRRLLERSPRSVKLTASGETLLGYALNILALNDEVVARVKEPELTGNLRLGTPEDFATTYLPDVLAEFTKSYPLVSLEVTCDLTLNLLQRFRAKEFDLALVKREPTAGGRGMRVWREALAWVSGEAYPLPRKGPVPLVVSPEPCVYRKRATRALAEDNRKWRVSYTCGSLAGAQAAVRAGLGIAVLPKDMIPTGLHVIEAGILPALRDTEIALLAGRPLSAPARRLHEHIVRSLEHASGK
jgi:DNA-binding transcriptional LysR family regulator